MLTKFSLEIKDGEKRRRVLHLACCLLPKPHRDTMEVLFCFLNWAASFSMVDEESGSKMDVHNLATVIAPNILFPNTKTDSMEDSFLAIEAVHTLIEYNEVMSEVSKMSSNAHVQVIGSHSIVCSRFLKISNPFCPTPHSSQAQPT